MAKNDVMLVNGKPMAQEQYVQQLKQAREANVAYKSTPAYKAEIESRRNLSEKRNQFVNDFIEFGKKQKLTLKEIGSIGYSLYLVSRKDQE